MPGSRPEIGAVTQREERFAAGIRFWRGHACRAGAELFAVGQVVRFGDVLEAIVRVEATGIQSRFQHRLCFRNLAGFLSFDFRRADASGAEGIEVAGVPVFALGDYTPPPPSVGAFIVGLAGIGIVNGEVKA